MVSHGVTTPADIAQMDGARRSVAVPLVSAYQALGTPDGHFEAVAQSHDASALARMGLLQVQLTVVVTDHAAVVAA
jgi:hypothetical protein